jgi:hypothetical protein
MYREGDLDGVGFWTIGYRTSRASAHIRLKFWSGCGFWLDSYRPLQQSKDEFVAWEPLTASALVGIDDCISDAHLIDAVVALHKGDGDIESGFNPCRQTGGCWKKASFHAVGDSCVGHTILHTFLLSSSSFAQCQVLDAQESRDLRNGLEVDRAFNSPASSPH